MKNSIMILITQNGAGNTASNGAHMLPSDAIDVSNVSMT